MKCTICDQPIPCNHIEPASLSELIQNLPKMRHIQVFIVSDLQTGTVKETRVSEGAIWKKGTEHDNHRSSSEQEPNTGSHRFR